MSNYIQNHGQVQQTVKKSFTVDAENQSIIWTSDDPYSLFNGSNAFTVSMWFKPSDLTNGGNLISNISAATFDGISLSERAAEDQLRVYLIDTFPGDTLRIDFDHNMVDNTWYHVVWTYSGTQQTAGINVYVDAVSLTRDTAEEIDSFNGGIDAGDPLQVGNGNFLGEAAQGSYSDVMFWDKELSPVEITSLYNSGVPINPRTLGFATNLVGWIRVDEDLVFYPNAYDSQTNEVITYTNIPVTNITTDVP